MHDRGQPTEQDFGRRKWNGDNIRARLAVFIPRKFLASVIDIVKGTKFCVDRQQSPAYGRVKSRETCLGQDENFVHTLRRWCNR